jgi:peptide/nickel transport system substrate-binding protein
MTRANDVDRTADATGLTRHDLLRRASIGGGALLAGGNLAQVASAAVSATPKPKRGGTLRVAITGGGNGDKLNPLTPVNNADYARTSSLFDPLVTTSAAGTPQLRLAEEITPNATNTVWTIRLRKGVTFHDGSPLTADDLIYTLRKIFDPKAPGSAAGPLKNINLKGIKKRDALTISIPLTQPSAILVETFASAGPLIAPVGFNLRKPVGTGAFKFRSFTPGVESVFDRNDHYWDNGKPYADQLVITDFSDPTSQINALIGGQADLANGLSTNSATQAVGGGAKVIYSPGGGWNPFTMRVDKAPFNDVRVRQAMRYLVDRSQMRELVFGGHGVLASDVFGIWAPEYDHSIPVRQHDISRAKSLLKAAGKSDLTVELVTSDVAQGVTQMAQVFAEQAKAAGVKVNVRTVTPNDFYGPNYLKWTFAQDYWYYNYYIGQVATATLPTAPFNECHFDDPKYNSLYAQAIKERNEGKRADLAHAMQHIDNTTGGYIIPFFVPVIDGFSSHVGGMLPSKVGASFNFWDFKSLWLGA